MEYPRKTSPLVAVNFELRCEPRPIAGGRARGAMGRAGQAFVCELNLDFPGLPKDQTYFARARKLEYSHSTLASTVEIEIYLPESEDYQTYELVSHSSIHSTS